MSSIILLVVAILLLFIVFKIAKEFFKLAALIMTLVAIIWLLHPVCQSNVAGEVMWRIEPIQYISRFLPQSQPVSIDKSQSVCTVWTKVQSFF